MIFSQDGPLPLEAYGALSPILVDKEAKFEFAFEDGWDLLEKWMDGEIGRPDEVPNEWKRLDQYLDLPMLRDDWESQGDSILWLHRRRGYSVYKGPSANYTAGNGQLETLKWVRANGGEWTHWAADWAAENGHLETLKWIRANGGEWTTYAANWAAKNGHLETLKWIRANGGEWTTDAADNAAENGHLETLQWIRDNGGGMSEPQI